MQGWVGGPHGRTGLGSKGRSGHFMPSGSPDGKHKKIEQSGHKHKKFLGDMLGCPEPSHVTFNLRTRLSSTQE
jgi:hypothetical protein